MTSYGMRMGVAVLLAVVAGCGTSDEGPKPETCTPRTCTDAAAQCGSADDGCGQPLDCGTCAEGFTCSANRCEEVCTKRTCAEAQAECGHPSDGCGDRLDCGTCADGKTCGAGGSFRCGIGSCTPRTCDDAGAECGALDDGCSSSLDCGSCPQGEACDANACSGTCHPTTCEKAGRTCGTLDDGCGTTLTCGTCGGSTPMCVDGACVMCASSADCGKESPNCVAGTCVACTEDLDCGNPSCDEWSACAFDQDPSCDVDGTQARSCHTPICNAGACGVKNTDETQDCGRSTQGLDCGTSCDDWSACATGSVCGESGTEARACVRRTCDAGVCGEQSYSDSQACTVDTTDLVCGQTNCCDPETRKCHWLSDTCYDGDCVSGC